MRVLAIDPGNEESAWCELLDGKPVAWGKAANVGVLAYLKTCSVRHPDDRPQLAIEMIASYGMAVGREVFETCLWIGRFMEAWSQYGGSFKLVYRKDVKLHICESPRANDANIRAALIDRYGPGKDKAVGTKKAPGPLFGIKGDEWAALAVALTAENANRAAA